ncbi:hypothetical protein L4C34_17745 [Vibrio profundum]|uniref:hypothetical protein n=1 Tax=Vibrio profundum TaxID=2910247 RepID=UPI003D09B906
MEKHLWEISLDDLRVDPIWYYKHCIDSDYDETILSPASRVVCKDPNVALIGLATFLDAKGQTYEGYVHLGLKALCYSQPCLFLEGKAVTLWFGSVNPSSENLPHINFPLVVTSTQHCGVDAMAFVIKGFDYIKENGEIVKLHS